MAINDISLTSGMRSNLLSLQNTVSLLDRTQTRLATGKKVNSAIDNATSFFAAQSLNSRASTIDSLKDAMGQAVSTIKAADKGITAITTLIEQAKGIAQQALSANINAGFDTDQVTINGLAIGDSITVGATTLTAGPTAVTTSTAYDSFTITAAGVGATDAVTVGGVAFTAVATTASTTTYDSVDADFGNIQVGDQITIGGVTYTATTGSTVVTGYTMKMVNSQVNDTIDVGGVTFTASTATGGHYFDVTGNDNADALALKAAIENEFGAGYILQLVPGSDTLGINGGTLPFDEHTVENNSNPLGIWLTQYTDPVPLSATDFDISGGVADAATNFKAAVDAQQMGAFTIADDLAGGLHITAGTSALTSTSVTSADITVTQNNTVTYAATDATHFLIGASDNASATNLQAKLSAYFGTGLNVARLNNEITITAGTMALGATSAVQADADLAVAATTTVTTAAGALAAGEFAVTGDDVIDAQAMANLINNTAAITALNYTATAENGVLTIANTAADVSAANVTVSDAAKMVEQTIAGTSELTDLVAQYNTVRTQIDELAEDSGYKGKNLLSATAGLRTLDVKFEGATLTVNGFDATTAGLTVSSALNGAGTTWTNGVGEINASIDQLDAALTTLRQQSSKMSGNLSIITVRQDFSNNMINTLTEGADKLTAADSNEEGANMLMLQTRQSLSTTALSLSAQAAQSVLKLFG